MVLVMGVTPFPKQSMNLLIILCHNKTELYTIKKKEKEENMFLLKDGMKAVKWNIPTNYILCNVSC
jgi:hypothetical protein